MGVMLFHTKIQIAFVNTNQNEEEARGLNNMKQRSFYACIFSYFDNNKSWFKA